MAHCFHCCCVLFHPHGLERVAPWFSIICCCFVCLLADFNQSLKQFCSLMCISVINSLTLLSHGLHPIIYLPPQPELQWLARLTKATTFDYDIPISSPLSSISAVVGSIPNNSHLFFSFLVCSLLKILLFKVSIAISLRMTQKFLP